jgi:hypothetical protein
LTGIVRLGVELEHAGLVLRSVNRVDCPHEAVGVGIDGPVARVVGNRRVGAVAGGCGDKARERQERNSLCSSPDTYGSGMEIVTLRRVICSASSSYSMLTSHVPSPRGVGQQLTVSGESFQHAYTSVPLRPRPPFTLCSVAPDSHPSWTTST